MTEKKRIFGTDGVRGTANIEPVTAETALKLGRAAAYVFKSLNADARDFGKHKIVIGKDTRQSGYMLENAIASGILSMGVDVLFVGPLPTPGVAYVTRSLRADAGIVITASHNPYTDNGIKFFRADGYKLEDHIERRIEDLVFSGEIASIAPSASEIGKAMRIDDALGRYIEFVKSSTRRPYFATTRSRLRSSCSTRHSPPVLRAHRTIRATASRITSSSDHSRVTDSSWDTSVTVPHRALIESTISTGSRCIRSFRARAADLSCSTKSSGGFANARRGCSSWRRRREMTTVRRGTFTRLEVTGPRQDSRITTRPATTG